jgi:hypothetical protein
VKNWQKFLSVQTVNRVLIVPDENEDKWPKQLSIGLVLKPLALLTMFLCGLNFENT